MEQIKQIILSVCAISIILGILSNLCPNVKLNNQLKLLMASILLLSVLIPAMKNLKDITPDWEKFSYNNMNSELTSNTEEKVLNITYENIKDAILKKLQKNNISVEMIDINMYIKEDNSINISNIKIRCSQPETAKQIISTYFGEEVEIIAERTN